jgi:hypothetical protein
MSIPKRDDKLTLVLCLHFDELEGRVRVVGEGHRLIQERWVVVAGDAKIPAGFGSRDS